MLIQNWYIFVIKFFVSDLQANPNVQDLVPVQNTTGQYQNQRNEAGQGTDHHHGHEGGQRLGLGVDPDLGDDQHPDLDIQDITHLGIEVEDLGKYFSIFSLKITIWFLGDSIPFQVIRPRLGFACLFCSFITHTACSQSHVNVNLFLLDHHQV